MDMRCSQADAVARASAWNPSLSGEAIIQQLRKEGSDAAIPTIKSASASLNYRLTGKLMLAFRLVHTEEQRAAEAAVVTNLNVSPRRATSPVLSGSSPLSTPHAPPSPNSPRP